MIETTCTCSAFNRGICDKRAGRGLKRFCDRTLKASGRDDTGTFSSYSAATEACTPGFTVRSCSPGFRDGSPRRFVLVPVRA